MMPMMSTAELLEKMPDIPWRKPLEVNCGDLHRLACRICVAQKGLHGSEVVNLPATVEEFERHMRAEHKPDS
jgi:hypothetical protein